MSRFNADDDALIPVKVVFAFPPDHMSGKHIVEVETELPISGDANHFFVNADKLLPVLPVKTKAELIDLMAAWAARVIKICPYSQLCMMEEKAVMHETIQRFLEERANRLTCDDCAKFDGKEHCQPCEGILRHVGDKTLAIQICQHFEPRKEV